MSFKEYLLKKVYIDNVFLDVLFRTYNIFLGKKCFEILIYVIYFVF